MSVSVSVVVVSRDRPDALYLCVLGLSQLQYSDFEIVVVADAKGLAAIEIFREQVKIVQFDEANISAARNMGISQSVLSQTFLTIECGGSVDTLMLRARQTAGMR